MNPIYAFQKAIVLACLAISCLASASFISPRHSLAQEEPPLLELPLITPEQPEAPPVAAPTWKPYKPEIDCLILEGSWQQSEKVDDATKQTNQLFKFDAGTGRKLMIAQPITPSFIIPELKASVTIKSMRRGVQLHARIVLPHNPLPDGEPMSVVLNGPVSKLQGRKETLSFTGTRSLHQLLEDQLWLLRSQHQREVTLRDAYVDQIWLNIYTGKGDSKIEVGEAALTGIVEATQIANQQSFADNTASHISSQASTVENVLPASSAPAEPLVSRDGTVLLVNKKPFFPRIIQHNGEPFDYLKAIGFNTVELKATATSTQLAEASRLGMWLIAAPPASVGVQPIGFEYDSVLAWSVGRDLEGKHASRIRQRIREIRETDSRQGRPIFGHSVSHWSLVAQQLDIHSIGIEPIGSSQMLSNYSEWLSVRSRAIGDSKPICADIQTEMNEAVLNQTSAIFGQSPPTPVEFQQMKSLAAEAIASGARCLRFRSRSRLDGDDPESRLRAETVQYTNRWLTQVEPFVAGGIVHGKLPTTRAGGGEVEITALATDKARLLLVQRPTHHEQFWAGDCPALPITVTDTDTIHTQRVYQLTDTELKPLATQRSAEGTQIRIEDAPFMTTLIMTQDGNLVKRINQGFGGNGTQSTFDLHLSITQQWLAIAQLLNKQMQRLSRSTESGTINDAVNSLQQARQAKSKQVFSEAETSLNRADERLAFFRRDLQSKALGTFQSKTSSVLTMHAALVPLHWILAGQAPQSTSSINHLAGGDFESLDHMMKSGWANQRIDDQRLRTHVELSLDAAKAGKSGLKLSTRSSLPLIETVPLWVSSPPVRVKARQLVRIHGWVNIPQVIRGSEQGFRIVDSLGGETLAETMVSTEGWKEFTLYRNTAKDTQLTIDLQLTGIGQVMVDEVTVQIIDLPAPKRSASRN